VFAVLGAEAATQICIALQVLGYPEELVGLRF